MPRTEIYYISNVELIDNYSRINYVQLDSALPYNSYAINGQSKIYTQDGVYAGMYYTNKTFQIDNEEKTINSTITNTMSIENRGIIFFMRSYDKLRMSPGDVTFSKPTFQSGIYLGADMEIILEIIPDKDLTIKVTFIISD